MKYFAVRKEIRINGKVYIPCVCYKATNNLIPAIESLVSQEKAIVSDNYLAFQNGRLLKEKPAPVPRFLEPVRVTPPEPAKVVESEPEPAVESTPEPTPEPVVETEAESEAEVKTTKRSRKTTE